MNEYKKLEKELEKQFDNCNFYVCKKDNEIEVIYDNKLFLNDNEFLDKVFHIAKKFLNQNDLFDLSTTYDLFGEIASVIKDDVHIDCIDFDYSGELKYKCDNVSKGLN